MFQSTSDVLEKRLLVEGAMHRLQTMVDYSPIAVRGVQLIGSLLAEDLARRVGSSNGRKRSARDANLPDVDSLAKRMSTISAATSPALGSTSFGLSPGASVSTLPPVNRASASIMADNNNNTGLLGGSSLLQDSQDALDWLLTNPIEASWGGGDGSESDPTFFSNGESTVDFWRLLEGHD